MYEDPVEGQTFKRTERCDTCRTRIYFRENGLLYCKNGHEQAGGPEAAPAEEYLRIGSQRSQQGTQPRERFSRIRRGQPGTVLYLQAYQIVLAKQAQALIHTIGLSSDVEVVIKELWALRLSLLTGRLEDGSAGGESMFSSQQTEESDASMEHRSATRWKGKYLPSLTESLGVCYLACMVLRLPMGMGELHGYAVREDIPFIRAVRWVPAALKKGMPPEYLEALDTMTPLNADDLRKAIQHVCLLFQHHFDLRIPLLNAPLLLFRHVRELALPLTVYQHVRMLEKLLNMDFAFPSTKGEQYISRLPEVALISLVIVAVKIFHPFDARRRYVDSDQNAAILGIDWSGWIAALQQHQDRIHDREHLRRGTEIHMTEEHAMQMTEEQMDDYLDWYERTWVDEERAEQKPRGFPKELLDMFPVGRPEGSEGRPYDFQMEADRVWQSEEQRLLEATRQLEVREVREGAEPDGPADAARAVGQLYKRYRSVEDLTPHARAFHAAAADVMAMKLESLLIAVFQVESGLIRWMEQERKSRRQRPDPMQ